MSREAPVDTAVRSARLLYAYRAAMEVQPHVAIWVVYLTDFRHLTLAQVGTLEAFFWSVSILAEVPTGAFSDRYGRRRTFLVASVVEGVGIAAFALASSYPVLLLAYVLWSLGLAFSSGNAGAFLYDALAAAGRTAEYVRAQGRLSAIGRGAFIVGSIFGALIAAASTLQVAIFMAVVPYAVAVLIAWRMADPPRAHGEEPTSTSYRGTFVRAAHALRSDPAIRWIILVSVSLDALRVAEWLLMQPFLVAHDVPVALFGLLAAPVRLVGVGTALLAHRFERRVGLRRGLGMMVIAIVGGVALIGAVDHLAAFAGYFLLVGGLGLIDPAVLGYLNGRVPRAIRATVLSVPPLGTSLAFAVTAASAGVLADASLRLAFVALAGTVLVVAGSAYVLWLRADAATPPPRPESGARERAETP